MEKYVNIEDVRENLKIFNEHIERLSKRFNQQAGYIVCALFASAWASMFASNPPLVKDRDLLFLVIVTAVIFFTLELVYLYLMVVKAQKIVRKIHDKPEQCNAVTRGWNIFVSKKTCFMIAKLLLILSMVIELAIYYFL